MIYVGLIWLFAAPLCWVVSPDRAGWTGTAIFAGLGLLLIGASLW